MNQRHIYLTRNALKLPYGNLGSKKFFGGQTPDPHPKGRSRLTRPGGMRLTRGGEEGGTGREREGEGKGDLALGFSDLEMTWLLYCAGAATALTAGVGPSNVNVKM